jgi:DNA processing protein
MSASNRKYWLGFSRAAGIGAVRLRVLLDRYGSIEAAWNASEASLQRSNIGAHAIAGLLSARRTLDLDAELARLEALGFDLLTWDEEAFPGTLLEIASPPVALYRNGAVTSEDRIAVAIVGTRRPTPYGQAVARDLATAVAVHGITVVSGLARGIDSVAHRAALDAGGRTIAVLGSGLDEVYPPEHRSLAGEIAQAGAVLSEFPLGAKPDGANFPVRNRIVAGLAQATVVVEAGESSGALITADFAAEQGREVFAVPGSIYSRVSRGTNRLILAGATPLASAEDILEALRLPSRVDLAEVERSEPEGELAASLMALLSDEPVHADELVARTRQASSEVLAALAMLELEGRAVQVGGMNFVRSRPPRRLAEPSG